MSATAPPGLREQKRIATRRALRLALLQQSLDRGFDAVTIEDVAQAAGVSPRTFFNYFASKEDAVAGAQFLAIPEEERARFLAGSADVLTDLVHMLARSVDDEDDLDIHLLRKRLMHRDARLLGMQVASVHRFNELAARQVVDRLRAEADAVGVPLDEAVISDRADLIVMMAAAVGRHGWSRWVSAGAGLSLRGSILAGLADFRSVCEGLTEQPAP